jgi:sialate O-acetylesterase
MKRFSLFFLTLLIFSVISSFNLYAEVKLPAIFCENMVLQQQTEAAFWGTASNNATVKITTSWNKKNYTARAGSDGKWNVKVLTPSAGGPYDK